MKNNEEKTIYVTFRKAHSPQESIKIALEICRDFYTIGSTNDEFFTASIVSYLISNPLPANKEWLGSSVLPIEQLSSNKRYSLIAFSLKIPSPGFFTWLLAQQIPLNQIAIFNKRKFNIAEFILEEPIIPLRHFCYCSPSFSVGKVDIEIKSITLAECIDKIARVIFEQGNHDVLFDNRFVTIKKKKGKKNKSTTKVTQLVKPIIQNDHIDEAFFLSLMDF